MKKILLLIFISTLTSCASRKVITDRTEIKKDSVVETKVTVTVTEIEKKLDSTNIILVVDNNEFTITPIDTTKEIIVEGKRYKNVILTIKKNKTNVSYFNKNKESYTKSKDSTSTNKIVKKETVNTKQKKIDKKQNNWGFILLLLLLLTIYTYFRAILATVEQKVPDHPRHRVVSPGAPQSSESSDSNGGGS